MGILGYGQLAGAIRPVASDVVADDFVYRILLFVLFAGFIAHRGYFTRKFGHPAEGTVELRSGGWQTRIANLLSLPGPVAVVVYIV